MEHGATFPYPILPLLKPHCQVLPELACSAAARARSSPESPDKAATRTPRGSRRTSAGYKMEEKWVLEPAVGLEGDPLF